MRHLFLCLALLLPRWVSAQELAVVVTHGDGVQAQLLAQGPRQASTEQGGRRAPSDVELQDRVDAAAPQALQSARGLLSLSRSGLRDGASESLLKVVNAALHDHHAARSLYLRRAELAQAYALKAQVLWALDSSEEALVECAAAEQLQPGIVVELSPPGLATLYAQARAHTAGERGPPGSEALRILQHQLGVQGGPVPRGARTPSPTPSSRAPWPCHRTVVPCPDASGSGPLAACCSPAAWVAAWVAAWQPQSSTAPLQRPHRSLKREAPAIRS